MRPGSAARPGSRSGGYGAPPPGTGYRPGQNMSGAPPGTGQRLGTASRPMTRGGVPVNTNINVTDRPVTQQGMTGMNVGNVGPGRQVMDKSYYLGLLRNKIGELTNEIQSLEQEAERANQDSSTFTALDRKQEGVAKEVQHLKGILADYNLLAEKLRDEAEVDEMKEDLEEIQEENAEENERLEKLFKSRQAAEAEVRQLNSAIEAIQVEQEQRLNELPEDRRNLYRQLKKENQSLMEKVAAKQAEYDRVHHATLELETELRTEPLKERMAALHEQVRQMERKKAALEKEDGREKLSIPEEREKLLKQVKDDNTQIGVLEQSIVNAEDEISNLRDQLAQVDSMLEDDGGEKSRKFEELVERDKEMQAFIDKFDELRDQDLEQKKRTQENVVELLQHISRYLERQRNMPSPEQLKGMQQDLEFKNQHLQNSQSTQGKLQEELQIRQLELDKINNLDSKISVEMQSLSEKMKMMHDELKRFANVDEVKNDHEKFKHLSAEDKVRLAKRRDALRQQVQLLQSKYEAKKERLASDETASQLENLEQKLRHYQQNNFQMQEFINAKKKESDYQLTCRKSFEIIDKINQALLKQTQPQY